MIFIEIIKAIILGIIQGITEWLPISSTGHMIIVNELIPMQMSTEFVNMFMVVIQFGSILAVLLLYFSKLNPFAKSKKDPEHFKNTMNLWYKVAIAAVPAAIIGFLFDDIIDKYLYNSVTVAITLIVYGFAFLWIESRKNKSTINSLGQLTYKTAAFIGIFQVLALIPGTSRSGATILGAVLLGCARPVAAEFSFFLAIPMMFGASLLKLLKLKVALDFAGIMLLVVGMVTAFVVSIIAIKTFMSYVRKHDFKVFGYYRIILGVIVLLYFAFLK
ncbi:MAG: undecaprenyl-diphosphate phosphatase [Anaerorhabdus sp.]|uniref:undecaprenyl-diphosphate phosphatase n=1 Tax=Anaerorhabdus sp. TaxID=1872524 RepID=UPI002B1EE74A|nr:undecaprenyl-diphosphate phosphatase [Anaerorhabdus sp.]MEA4874524.1 undecaprenyl-diphosphate phosphatase [Anaerorhabdus sp.]